ncbi:MAG TPA: sensor histidine kinase [Candidatus Dormibacteraeota bacterium]|nr:sensor histidine kinase [Candidatus Dormibacteraeota bacterium]
MALVDRAGARALLVDGLLAVLLGIVMVVGTEHAAAFQASSRRPPDGVAYALMVPVVLGVAGRRLAPLPSLAVVTLAVAAYLGLRYAYGPVLLAEVVALYSAGSNLPPRRSMPAAAAAIGLLVAAEVAGSGGRLSSGSIISLVAWHGWLLVPWAAGAAFRARRESGRRDRDEAARRIAYEERLRVAREVHDVVGHGLAVINMQAGVALHVVDRRPEQARVALEAIKQTSKDALEELRGTLAVFREPAGAERAREARQPAPGLDQVQAVVAAMGEGGLPVELVVSGEPVALPAAVDLAAYRIVQESLTNVARHAGPAAATVRLSYEPGQVVVEVTDDGRARAHGTSNGGGARGHGIAGMRERAAAVHGTLEAGPRPEGGFRVMARLPSGSRRR